ncbi:alkaline phosphatase family protein [Chromobacterium sp. IIBBL 290-4]|uniref:alkaline phosphatase family protein n=1 Tax=Chromobacterium sp. IIBBL 290-4 TaxID=2953890 RepID=UPI0020B7DD16|nr:alkaline phosphatase family protein [Chromobacterium sp. IIBBL 290-4]UTH75944.1 alkaline phosphatase family protein [Chromobacterium sp. IIBBL 290-4]
MENWNSRFPGAAWPDYQGGGLLNLMQTLSLELGGPDLGHAPLDSEVLAGIGRHRHVCLLLVDGLGEAQLRRLGPNSRLAALRRRSLSSVFPPTTAAAVTTVLTGQPPSVHGLIGWHQLHGEEIIAPLPLYVRHPADSASAAQQLADSLFCAPPLFEHFARPAFLMLPADIAHSPCTRHHAGSCLRLPYRDSADAFAQLSARLSSPAPAFHYLYLRQLDAQMHATGPDSPQAQQALAELDDELGRLLEEARQCDAAVVAIADHGFTAAPAAQWVDVDADQELYGLLARPLSGETRMAYCHVKPGCVERFLALAEARLGHACWPARSAELLAAGVYGPGPAHPDLARRCGDVVLIAKPGWNLRDTLPGERVFLEAGMHAGVHPDEMAVPLMAWRP